MKTKKLLIGVAGVALSFSIFASSSFAAITWYACTPGKIGPFGDKVRLYTTNCKNEAGNTADASSGKNGWLTLNTTGTDQQMATILTAMSLTKPIGVGVDGSKDSEGYNYAASIMFNNQ